MALTVLGIILEAFKFGLAIFVSAMDDKRKAAEAQEKFDITQERRRAWADAAITKLGLDAKKSSTDAGSAWDKQDGDRKP
jgi:hypothetical protein